MHCQQIFPLAIVALAVTGCDEPRLLGGPGTITVKIPDEMRDRGFLGVEFDSDQKDVSGAVARSVLPDSPADHAGIAAGDKFIELDDHTVSSLDDFMTVAKLWKPKQVVSVKVLRDEQELEFEVSLMTAHELMQLRAFERVNDQYEQQKTGDR